VKLPGHKGRNSAGKKAVHSEVTQGEKARRLSKIIARKYTESFQDGRSTRPSKHSLWGPGEGSNFLGGPAQRREKRGMEKLTKNAERLGTPQAKN